MTRANQTPAARKRARHVAKAAARGAALGLLPTPARLAVEHAAAAKANPRGTRKAAAKIPARAARKPARKTAAKRAPVRRRNPVGAPAPVGGKLMSRRVLAVAYYHAGSAQRLPYQHDFERDGVELYAMPNGSLVIRHPKYRLWGDFTVSDRE